MKKLVVAAILAASAAATLPAQARDMKHLLPISAALQPNSAREELDKSVKLFFGPQAHPRVVQAFGTIKADGKEPIVDRMELASCYKSFAWALKQLQQNAKSVGANAVVNIVSYYKRGAPMASETEFECHAGSFSTGLMVKGDLVKIEDK